MAQTNFDDLDLDAIMQARHGKLLKERLEQEVKLAEIDRALSRIEGYLNPSHQPAHRTEAKPKPTGTRAASSAIQKDILAVIQRYLPDGAKAESINAELAGTCDAKQIAAALNRMKNAGVIAQAARRQPYTLGPKAPPTSAPAPAGEPEPTPAEEPVP